MSAKTSEPLIYPKPELNSRQPPLPRGVIPLDFSFKCLCSLNDLIDETPRPREGKNIKSKKIIEYVAKTQVNNLFQIEELEPNKEDGDSVHFSDHESVNSEDTEIDFYNTGAKNKAKELMIEGKKIEV